MTEVNSVTFKIVNIAINQLVLITLKTKVMIGYKGCKKKKKRKENILISSFASREKNYTALCRAIDC
jgi:hypothetical protein